MKQFFLIFLSFSFLSACVTIRQDEVGYRRRFGKLREKTLNSGFYLINPFTTTMIKVPTRTTNLTVTADLPTKEGLTVKTEVTLLYRVQPNKIVSILKEIGKNYENNLVAPAFRSAIRDVSARFFAKDLHTAERATIEQTIAADLDKFLKDKGFVIEAVLLKSIKLPERLVEAIEAKLQAEQEAQRMQFVLEQEKLEAQRRIIEAQGTRDAQKILAEGLNPLVLQFQYIQAWRELAKSPNTKVIITDGQMPYMLNEEQNSVSPLITPKKK
ncbi:prohibitin family protein [Raineya orbicola]|jgi:regulator of protease activity HflC (stomatin/prohibitin superfamily)|uniref:SPFH domain / Band 7 family n=1 Tax=Raineya orbicola TaxID=2016530 RepID=A0A2N3II35_9BACT|nr:prohibitin family protein [Raineya orbicola]PKQ69964.1 SPFH domain / Band 7 family [Raineya orbicola]